ncbi:MULTISPECIES: energy transducer TonB [Pseudoalteromonas]|jgi:protein TonB|uniref:energy transducer TonB n=2 Tax=Pseudoalteromonas TaxID=53246 RepID=UPI0003FC9222|nr:MULTISPECIES: energy transducer TonB [Pseudoalteromonas]MBB1349556.1 energy transducer TonB [Pseudoalteromonas sp. SG45-3]MBB1360326.1 energy transducer TonB [Pseudoalteromonas sp. SG45-6]MBB1401810.1 energy transducer TonB [Pseudoalteromonas sp. SG45-1]MBB1430813.1 energy transducer TonB [Pseudoalteromonas sp. SG43-4]MBB1441803.1 energy transducer TonB [Pseudoalteromonas sp. SG43-3]|tara:strand:- start:288 stop:770 length:483 start_codon:yes stop_codon:yes gene_type:complete
MKALYLLLPLTSLLAACGATPTTEETVEKLDYIDLSSVELRDRVKDYWNILTRTEPQYPIAAAKKGLAGCVELMTIINSEGRAQGYKVTSSYPKGLFDEAAAQSLSTWAWLPTNVNVAKQPVLTHIRIDFTIDSKPVGEKYLKNCPAGEAFQITGERRKS